MDPMAGVKGGHAHHFSIEVQLFENVLRGGGVSDLAPLSAVLMAPQVLGQGPAGAAQQGKLQQGKLQPAGPSG